MFTIVSLHSLRGGTGKSNITANLACSMVQRGERVAIVDSDVQSPDLHALFDLDAGKV
jgi:MinD-like ATPase involved in chromosome partitioning or flagellar assembly